MDYQSSPFIGNHRHSPSKGLNSQLSSSKFATPLKDVIKMCSNEPNGFDSLDIPDYQVVRIYSYNDFRNFFPETPEHKAQPRHKDYCRAFRKLEEQQGEAEDKLRNLFRKIEILRPLLPNEMRYRMTKVRQVYSSKKERLNSRLVPPHRLAYGPIDSPHTPVLDDSPMYQTPSPYSDSSNSGYHDQIHDYARGKNKRLLNGKSVSVTFDRVKKKPSKKDKKGGPRKKRGTLPKEAVKTLRKWLFNHFAHPYPTDDEKHALSSETGLKVSQVNYWFINARVRIWRPMIEGSKPFPPDMNERDRGTARMLQRKSEKTGLPMEEE